MTIRVNVNHLSPYLNLSYDELEERNLAAKYCVGARSFHDDSVNMAYYVDYLKKESKIKAVTVCFSDMEGRLYMLDYDKKYFMQHHDGLMINGEKVYGPREKEHTPYLRLLINWASFRWLPADLFGVGKVLVFASIRASGEEECGFDARSLLCNYLEKIRNQEGLAITASLESEGFLFDGVDSEQNYRDESGFQLISKGGYFHALPGDPLKKFIDRFADVKRCLGFENEGDQPELAPSQFELNYRPCDPLVAADQLQMYKVLARQIAASMGYSASFLPKPISSIHGSGARCLLSVSKHGKDIWAGKSTKWGISSVAEGFVQRILGAANELSLVFNPSVNAYRRLESDIGAPTQIKATLNEGSSIVKVPPSKAGRAVVQVSCLSPDINPYLALYSILRTGFEGHPYRSVEAGSSSRRSRTRCLPDNIHDAIRHFRSSEWVSELLGSGFKEEFVAQKQVRASRSPKSLGRLVKESEILYHHEVTNQFLWSQF